MSSEPARMDAPSVDVTLPAALIRLFPGAPSQLALQAGNVAGLLDRLDRDWPGMSDRLRDERPRIRRHINIFVNGQRATLETPLKPGDRVFIITAVSGG